MTEVLAQRKLLAPAEPEAVDKLHDELALLWDDAAFVPELDQMAFATAVVEAATNVVQHGIAAKGRRLMLGVDLSIMPSLLHAKISEIGAQALPDLTVPEMPGEDFESGRGLALIEALVTTVTVERRGDTNTWILSRESAPFA